MKVTFHGRNLLTFWLFKKQSQKGKEYRFPGFSSIQFCWYAFAHLHISTTTTFLRSVQPSLLPVVLAKFKPALCSRAGNIVHGIVVGHVSEMAFNCHPQHVLKSWRRDAANKLKLTERNGHSLSLQCGLMKNTTCVLGCAIRVAVIYLAGQKSLNQALQASLNLAVAYLQLADLHCLAQGLKRTLP